MLTHGEKFAATVDDLRTVRVIKEQLELSLKEHNRIRDCIKDEMARAEFESVFADDIKRIQQVIKTCEERLYKDVLKSNLGSVV